MIPVNRKNSWLPDVFNDFFDTDFMPKANATAPAINVKESEIDYEVEVAAPGMTKEDFNVHLNQDGDLSIKMESKKNNAERRKRLTICVVNLPTASLSRH